MGLSDSSVGKESVCNEGDPGSVPGLGRSPGEGKGYPLQYPGLENPMDRIVLGVAKSWTQLCKFHFHFFPYRSLESIEKSYYSLRDMFVRVPLLYLGKVNRKASEKDSPF